MGRAGKGSPGEGRPRGPAREAVTTIGGQAPTEHRHYLGLSSRHPPLRVRPNFYCHFTSEKRGSRKAKGLAKVTKLVVEAGAEPGLPPAPHTWRCACFT